MTPAEIKCSLCRRETAITCRDSVGYLRSREEVYRSRRMPQCYPGGQCTSERQKHIQATQEAPIYQGAIMRFPNGNGFIFSVGPFPIILPPFIVQSEALTGTARRVNHP